MLPRGWASLVSQSSRSPVAAEFAAKRGGSASGRSGSLRSSAYAATREAFTGSFAKLDARQAITCSADVDA